MESPMSRTPIAPISLVDLFPMIREELLTILQSLTDEEWQAPTACTGWSVKDVALHILADDVGYLSRHRDQDGYTVPHETWEELVAGINAHNERWVEATRRMSRK